MNLGFRLSNLIPAGNSIYCNPSPNSTSSTRMVRAAFEKETVQTLIVERDRLISEAKCLKTSIKLVDKEFRLKYDIFFTMLDAVAINKLEACSNNQCFYCGKIPKPNIRAGRRDSFEPVTQEAAHVKVYKYGISCLHSWLRVFAWFCNLAYKSEVKKWAGPRNVWAPRKKVIDAALERKFNMHMNKPKQRSGDSITGNVARDCFSRSQDFAEATGLRLDLIDNFLLILVLLNTKSAVDVDKFEKLCDETSRLIETHYGWACISPYVHRILEHGPAIMREFPVPLGVLSEEPSECSHKVIRKGREEHARKLSRAFNNRDMAVFVNTQSDPLLHDNAPKTKHLSEKASDYLL